MSDEQTAGMQKVLPGLTRNDEEQHLAMTIEVAQRNLDEARKNVEHLNEDMEYYMSEANRTRDKALLTLWNDAKAQFTENVGWLPRYEKARKKPYFGRIDFHDEKDNCEEAFYIGRVGISKSATEPVVIDWRTPVASVYYENQMGKGEYTVNSGETFPIDLKRKRNYEIENDTLKEFYDLDVVANDDLLTKYLAKNKSEVLGEIIATIQKDQNRIIRRSPKTNIIVQGAAGSGKTTVAMHRISYILFNYEDHFRPDDFYIIGNNQILLNYITSVLPELDVYGARQMTMEQLFIRLLYHDWNDTKYAIRSLDKNDEKVCVKGSRVWFGELERFCRAYEAEQVCSDNVYMEKTGVLLIDRNRIVSYLAENPGMSMQSKCLMLNEILFAKYENEILGKNISFTPEEKKAMEKKYRFYFGKDEWKGSVFEVYERFLKDQLEKGYDIAIPFPEKKKRSKTEDTIYFDVYDLAALAYIYKKIKEIDPIREASHVVIDEAQDFGMMAYECLNYCMRGCTYTIMGDTSQNIHFQNGLNDWNDLRELILTGPKDAFGLLKKSYRNTVEIANFASDILRHGSFSIYPIEPIIRHGNEVNVAEFSGREELLNGTVKTIQEWQKQGYETIAVICRDEEEASVVTRQLKMQIDIKEISPESAEFGNGVMVLPISYTKGLEFDAVIIYNPTTETYPADDGHVKMLYVAATRALHELAVLHSGNLTTLIAEKAPEGKHLEEFEADTFLEEEEKQKAANAEQIRKQVSEGIEEDEANRKNYVWEKLAKQQKQEKSEESGAKNRLLYSKTRRKINNTDDGKQSSGSDIVPYQTEKTDRNSSTLQADSQKSIGLHGHMVSPEQKVSEKNSGLIFEDEQTGSGTVLRNKLQRSDRGAEDLSAARRNEKTVYLIPINESPFSYGTIPDSQTMKVNAHRMPEASITGVKRTKNGILLESRYGTLSILPMTKECVRIVFEGKKKIEEEKNTPDNSLEAEHTERKRNISMWKMSAEENMKWSAKASASAVEIATEKMIIHVEKKDGSLHFLTRDRRTLLSEKRGEPRILEGTETWNFFELDLKEKLKSMALHGKSTMTDISLKARYISFGGRTLRMPFILSRKGYAIGVNSEKTVMYCGNPMYGPYLYTEGTGIIDYYFMYGGSDERNIEMYHAITGMQ